MFRFKREGTFLDEGVEATDKVKAVLAGVRDKGRREDPKGANVVTGNAHGAGRYLVESAKDVGDSENSDEASKFTAIGVSIWDWAWDGIDSYSLIKTSSTFNDEGSSAKFVLEGGITNCKEFCVRQACN